MKKLYKMSVYVLICIIALTVTGINSVFASASFTAVNELNLLYGCNGVISKAADENTVHTAGYTPNGPTPEGEEIYMTFKVDGDVSNIEFVQIENERGSNWAGSAFNTIYVSNDGTDGNWQEVAMAADWSYNNNADIKTKYTEGGNCLRKYSKNAIPADMTYVKLVYPEIYTDAAVNNIVITDVKIEYSANPLVSTPINVAITDNVVLTFTKEMDINTIVPDNFRVDNDISVVDAELLDDNKTCILYFDRVMERSKKYTITVGDNVLSLAGYPIVEDGRVLTVETPKGAGSYTFEDDAKTLDRIHEINGTVILSTSAYDAPVYGLSGADKDGYVVYKMEGNITGFNIFACGAGRRQNFEGEQYYPFLWVSTDGETYTQLENTVHYTQNYGTIAGTTNNGTNWRLVSKADALPDNSRYLKIQFPTKKSDVTVQDFERAVKNVTIDYTVGSATIYRSDCNVAVNDKGAMEVSIDLGITNELVSPVQPSDITIKDSDITCIKAEYNSANGRYKLTFDKEFEFGLAYTLMISEDITDIYGLKIKEENRSVEFIVPARPELLSIIDAEYKINGDLAEALTAGEYINTVNLTGGYFEGYDSKDITLVSVLYRNDKIIDVKTETKTVYVNYNTEYELTHTISDADTCVETFIIDGIVTRIPVSKSLELRK